MAGGKAGNGGGHFFGGVGVAGAARGLDAGGEGLAGFGVAREAHIKLAELEISGDVIGMRLEECVEMIDGRVGVALIGTFEGESVLGEGVAGMRGEEFFEFLTARFHWLGHGVRVGIICVRENCAN